MHRILLSLALTLAYLLPLGAQTKPEQKPLPPIPQNVTFRFFFDSIEFLENAATREAAAGRDGSKARGQIQRLAALNNQETAPLKRVALDCKARDNDFQAANTARIPDLASQSRGQGQAAENAKREIAQLSAARERIVTDCVTELKTVLGTKRFGQLHAVAEAYVKPRLSYSAGNASRKEPAK